MNMEVHSKTKKNENTGWGETHKSRVSTINLYKNFNDFTNAIKMSVDYNEMDVVDRGKLDESINRIEVFLKQMIESEALCNSFIPNLEVENYDHLQIGDQFQFPDEDDDDMENEFRPEMGSRLQMKNEFYYQRILFVNTKKRYIGLQELREGNKLSGTIDDMDVKGFEFNNIIAKYVNSIEPFYSIACMHKFNSAVIARKLFSEAKLDKDDKLSFRGVAITVDDMRDKFKGHPHAGDFIYFAYCKNPTFILYVKNRYVGYQYITKDKSFKKIFSEYNIDELSNCLNSLDVDSNAFDKNFNALKLICRRRVIDFNVLYREIVKCYSDASGIGSNGYVTCINFRPTNSFASADDCKRYAKSQGYDGHLFMVEAKWFTDTADCIEPFFILVVYDFSPNPNKENRAKYFKIGVSGGSAISMIDDDFMSDEDDSTKIEARDVDSDNDEM